MLKSRRERLGRFLDEQGLDAMLFTSASNIRYFCGFSGSEGVLVTARDSAWFMCDSRYTTQASEQVRDAVVSEFTLKHAALAKLTSEQSFRRLGFEATFCTVSFYSALSKAVTDCELVPLESQLDVLRSLKDADEQASLAAVAQLASTSLHAVLPLIKAGVRESDIALELEIEMRKLGADGRAFDFIVASGVRGAMPHGTASDKLIGRNELVTIDFGAVKDGYHSDETVTVAVGNPDGRSREIHAVVKAAHDLAIAHVRPGMTCRDLDAMARNHIHESGYGEYFGHGLGHGVGLEIHEKPVLSPRSDTVIEEGMVFTIEPGIYIPGFGGVRIEDTVVVTATGCRVLTSASKELLQL